MSAELDALHAAEAVLKVAEEKLAAAEAPVAGGEPGPDAPPAASGAESVYLGHIGEPATKGKDY